MISLSNLNAKVEQIQSLIHLTTHRKHISPYHLDIPTFNQLFFILIKGGYETTFSFFHNFQKYHLLKATIIQKSEVVKEESYKNIYENLLDFLYPILEYCNSNPIQIQKSQIIYYVTKFYEDIDLIKQLDTFNYARDQFGLTFDTIQYYYEHLEELSKFRFLKDLVDPKKLDMESSILLHYYIHQNLGYFLKLPSYRKLFEYIEKNVKSLYDYFIIYEEFMKWFVYIHNSIMKLLNKPKRKIHINIKQIPSFQIVYKNIYGNLSEIEERIQRVLCNDERYQKAKRELELLTTVSTKIYSHCHYQFTIDVTILGFIKIVDGEVKKSLEWIKRMTEFV